MIDMQHHVAHADGDFTNLLVVLVKEGYSSIVCKITGHKKYRCGKDLEIPCVYIFAGKQVHLEQLITLIDTS